MTHCSLGEDCRTFTYYTSYSYFSIYFYLKRANDTLIVAFQTVLEIVQFWIHWQWKFKSWVVFIMFLYDKWTYRKNHNWPNSFPSLLNSASLLKFCKYFPIIVGRNEMHCGEIQDFLAWSPDSIACNLATNRSWVKVAALYPPPQFAQSLAELSVVQMRILVRQLLPRCLRPNHKRVHRPFHVRFALQPPLSLTGHGQQRPVVTLQHLRHRVADAGGEARILPDVLRLFCNPGMARCLLVVASTWRGRGLGIRPKQGHRAVAACWTLGNKVCQWLSLFCHSSQVKVGLWDSRGTLHVRKSARLSRTVLPRKKK